MATRRPKSAASCRWVRSRWTPSIARSARSTTPSRRARIGQQTNYDRLSLEIWTDGTMTPEAALRESAKLLVRHLTLIAGADVTPAEQATAETRGGVPSRIYDVPIEDLELTVRAYNCLKRAGITKVGEVLERLEKGEEEILAIRNFGRKSLNELVEKLEGKGYLSAIAYQPSTELAEFEDGGEAEEESLRGAFVMRHRVAGYKLGRNTSQRSCLAAQSDHRAVPLRPHPDDRGEGQVDARRGRAPDHGCQARPGRRRKPRACPSPGGAGHHRSRR